MFATTTKQPARFGDRDLAALIALYESNFYRLEQVAPELDGLNGTVVSRVAGALDLYLTVLERHKYTTTISLTYRFGGCGELVLEPFARAGVNLTAIQSRPIKGKPWEYLFFIDLEGHVGEQRVASALDAAARFAHSYKLLGSFPRADQRARRATPDEDQ